jgi:predicted acylesterase/phospholipase RssA
MMVLTGPARPGGARRARTPATLAAALLALAVVVAGCATEKRLPAEPAALETKAQALDRPYRFLVLRDVDSFVQEGRASFEREKAWRASQGLTGPLPPADMLAISGGADDGAFGAGLIAGWTASGKRPEFKAVTGISTGALIAPFAFLGPRYDPVLEEVYTRISQKDVFKKRSLLKGVFSDGMADTTPLYRMIEKHVDPALLQAIAAEYAKGRLLLIGTTNLDSSEPVIWNMTAIAASGDPRALVLFRRVLLASAAIPGAFPPVMIDVTVDGQRYQEMHVDGGAMRQVFAYPPSVELGKLAADIGAVRERHLYVIRNAPMDADWAEVQRRTLTIAGRAVSTLIQSQGVGDLYRIYAAAQRDGVDFNLAYIPSTFEATRKEQFDTAYMQALFKVGRDAAAAGYPWQKVPPGFAPDAGGLP